MGDQPQAVLTSIPPREIHSDQLSGIDLSSRRRTLLCSKTLAASFKS
jgi:hypothetical protein